MHDMLYLLTTEVVHCTSPELASQVVLEAHKCGRQWRSGNSYEDASRWHYYKKNTCYDFYDGLVQDLGYSKSCGFNIISGEEFLLRQKEKTYILDP